MAKIEFQQMQLGDVNSTHADVRELYEYTRFLPKINIDDGVKEFSNWYLEYINKN